MAAYITQDEFIAAVGPFAVSDSDELARILDRAGRDVELYCGPHGRLADGSVFGDLTTNPRGLDVGQLTRLRNAVAYQALYRIQNGEDWALGGGDLYQSSNGPDFSVTGKRPLVSPRVKQELMGSGLVVRSARVA